ncbi:MAG: DNA-binding domain-containing protein [Burkholderiaceae bacterium]
MNSATASEATLLPAFWQALLAPPGTPVPPAMVAIAGQPGFAVYRNTCIKGCVDALAAQFPAVQRLVGVDWFRAAAADHVRTHPPRDGRLLRYGQAFPAFLRDLPPAADLPYLADVATLDWLWAEAHVATDADPLPPGALATLDACALETTVLSLHPATRWALSDDTPLLSLWQAAREQRDDPNPAHWAGEGALLTRPHDQVLWAPLTPGACALLDACRQGRSIAAAVDAAFAAEPSLDLPATLALLLQQGAFTVLAHHTPPEHTP